MPTTLYMTGATTTSSSKTVWYKWVSASQTATSAATIVSEPWESWAYSHATNMMVEVIQRQQLAGQWVVANDTDLSVARGILAERRQAEQAVQILIDEADKRAEALLKCLLTPAQLTQYERTREFEVFTQRAGKIRRYKLTYGWAGNAFLLDEQGQSDRKVLHPPGCYGPHGRPPAGAEVDAGGGRRTLPEDSQPLSPSSLGRLLGASP